MSPELLAPAGTREAFYAAVENRVDAVYLGGKQFGARAYADNFTNEDLRDMIAYAHLFDVKVYVTVNTIVFDEEIDEAVAFLDFLYENGCDGVIVQDLGIADIIRHRYPDFPLHASTQMNIHSLAQVKTLKELGFRRVVLARELSLEEIKMIRENVDIEVEVFIHGALCVSASGNCYFSSIVGKRSGNRGRCAQPCRLEYTIGNETGYLISPKDLMTLDHLQDMIDAGIDSFKIEGRMKRPEYVAQVVKSYREALDNIRNGTSFAFRKNLRDLETIFNRSFTKGFLFHEENNRFVNKESSNHIGIEVGKVLFSSEDWVQIRLSDHVEKNDSIRIVGEQTDAITLNQFYIGKKEVTAADSGDIIRVRPHVSNLMGGSVFLTSASRQLRDLEASYTKPTRKIPLTGRCFTEDGYLTLTVTDGTRWAKARTEQPIAPALTKPSNDRIEEQLKKTADSAFFFETLTMALPDPIFVPVTQINEMRRSALKKLKEARENRYPNRILSPSMPAEKVEHHPLRWMCKVKVRSEEQLKAVLQYPVDEIYVTQKHLLSLKEQYPNVVFRYVLPRINKSENRSVGGLVSSELSVTEGAITSCYMNIANAYAVHFLEVRKALSVGLSIELSFDQIKKLLRTHEKLFGFVPNTEVMVYGRYELMMMKYCPVQNTLGCKACQEKVILEDRKGFSFPVFREEGCSVKILNSRKLHLAEYLDELKDVGITGILLDFTDETYEETIDVCKVYFQGKNIKIGDVTYGHFREGVL